MAFADNLKRLPPVADIEKLELTGADGSVVAVIENKPGQAGSLALYHHLWAQHGAIDAAAAKEGLDLYAEHVSDAEMNPGKHPNIDRLIAVIANRSTLRVTVHRKH